MVAVGEHGALPLLPALQEQAVMAALREHGGFALALPPELDALNRDVFALYHRFDAQPHAAKSAFALGAAAADGENNGWHSPGGLSRYNRYREGYIFQYAEPIPDMLADEPAFARTHERWRDSIWEVAAAVMAHVARALGLAPGYFEPGGAMDLRANSQFHLKSLALPADDAPRADAELSAPTADAAAVGSSEATAAPPTNRDGVHVLLPAHTDPSVLSIIVHNEHGRGLQVFSERSGARAPDGRTHGHAPSAVLTSSAAAATGGGSADACAGGGFCEAGAYGPGVCTVLAGAVLERIAGGAGIRSPKHRVAFTPAELARMRGATGERRRTAATFFFQPEMGVVLRPLDARVRERGLLAGASTDEGDDDPGRAAPTPPPPPITYAEWKRRAFKQYYGAVPRAHQTPPEGGRGRAEPRGES